MNWKAVIFTISLISLVGCSKHDVPYYESNLDKAEVKLKECKDDILDAISNKDMGEVESIQNDAECKAAQTAKSIAYKKELMKAFDKGPIVIDETPLHLR